MYRGHTCLLLKVCWLWYPTWWVAFCCQIHRWSPSSRSCWPFHCFPNSKAPWSLIWWCEGCPPHNHQCRWNSLFACHHPTSQYPWWKSTPCGKRQQEPSPDLPSMCHKVHRCCETCKWTKCHDSVTLLDDKTVSAYNKIGIWRLLTLTKDCCSMLQSALHRQHDHQAFDQGNMYLAMRHSMPKSVS